jgi:two-component system nitrogen regulation sensor histidine kinase NtrY
MDFYACSAGRTAVHVAWRAALIGLLVFLAIWLIAVSHLYATATLALLFAGLVTADLAYILERAGGPENQATMSATAAPLVRQRAFEHQRETDHLHSLLDTVPAALIVIRSDERIVLANRAARKLAAQPVDRLDAVVAIGSAAARSLLNLAPGARSIVSFADGVRVFASVSQFVSPTWERLRLLALQRITGELDAVELNAWREMAHVLSHEMMNSLTPIASLSESLERLLGGCEPAEVTGALEAIRRRSTGLMDFVTRYRAIADLPSPRAQRVRLDELLGGVSRLLSAKFVANGIAYRTRIEPQDLTADIDPQLLEQAIINLLRNAADAVIVATEPCIEVTCRAGDEHIVIEVADNGCGIAEDKRDQVFIPFFTTKVGGSGIGLNLARQIALSHGGRLELRLREPTGSVFTLLLPAAT